MTDSPHPTFSPHAIDLEERSVDPDAVKKSTGDLLAALNWHHGDDEIDRDVHHDRV